MIEVPVYAPKREEDGPRSRLLTLRHIEPRSAIVGRPSDDPRGEYLTVYYEGNKFGAANMVTFADRAMFAYWRMRDSYPTVAMMACPRAALLRIGTLYPEHGRIEPRDARDLYELARWLEIPLEDSRIADRDRLASELRCDGVRV